MSFSEFTDPGPWLRLYAELPDDLDGLVGVVKNLLVHPTDIRRHGMRLPPRRWAELRELYTVERLLGELMKRPPPSLVAARSPWARAVEPCDVQALLMASFCEAKGCEVRLRCGFAGYIAKGMWISHWLTEVRRPHFAAWTLVDPDRGCRPRREEFRSGAQMWRRRELEPVGYLAFGAFRGVDAVKFAMLSDFHALNRRELVHYRWSSPRSAERGPRVFELRCAQLGRADREFLEHVAAAVTAEEPAELERLFASADYRPRRAEPARKRAD
jgi:hypothetical protein